MQAVYKIENLLPASFGGIGLPFPNLPENNKEWPELPEGLNQYSALGTKFYLPVGLKLEGTLYQLPWEPSMTISMRKTIVKTALPGNTRRGTVKELINTDDLIITLQGICYDHERKGYPFDQVEILKSLFEYNGSLEIVSALTELYEIKNVVMEDKQLPGVTGRPYTQPYFITLSSDEDFILIID